MFDTKLKRPKLATNKDLATVEQRAIENVKNKIHNANWSCRNNCRMGIYRVVK